MDGVKVTKVTAEEAQAFRDRVKKQNEEFAANWIVVDVGDFIEAVEERLKAGAFDG
jgi:hypothetical protein